MSVIWLSQFPNGEELAQVLLDKGDVFSLNDLAAKIHLEEIRPDTEQLVPPEVKKAFHDAFGDGDKGLYAGNTMQQMANSFLKLVSQDAQSKGSIHIKAAALSESMVHLGQQISLEEIGKLLETVDGHQGDITTTAALKKDSQISFVEYCRFMRFKLGGRTPPSIKHALRKLFLHYDRDKNGELDLTEVKKLLRSLSLSDIDAATLISSADKNGDGKLSFDEIYKFIQHGAQGPASEAWNVLKIWLQLSSGWDLAPKDPAELAKLQQESPNAKIVTFIRHGQSEGNKCSDLFGSARGCFNPYITPKGVAQARARGEQLKDTKFDLIVLSPMRRTIDTFYECIGNTIDPSVPVIGHPLAREQFSESDDIGDPPAQIKLMFPKIDWSFFPDQPEVWWYPGEQYTAEDIPKLTVRDQRSANIEETWEEPWGDLMKRAADFETFLASRPERHICVFSHGGFIEALVGPRMDNAQSCVLKVHNKVPPPSDQGHVKQ